jgi:hypothetical protein
MQKRKTPEFYDADQLRQCDLIGVRLIETHYPAGFERALHRFNGSLRGCATN